MLLCSLCDLAFHNYTTFLIIYLLSGIYFVIFSVIMLQVIFIYWALFPYGWFLQYTFQAAGLRVRSLDMRKFLFYPVTEGLWGSRHSPPHFPSETGNSPSEVYQGAAVLNTRKLGQAQSPFQGNIGPNIMTCNLHELGSQQGVAPTLHNNFSKTKKNKKSDQVVTFKESYVPLISIK